MEGSGTFLITQHCSINSSSKVYIRAAVLAHISLENYPHLVTLTLCLLSVSSICDPYLCYHPFFIVVAHTHCTSSAPLSLIEQVMSPGAL